MERPQVPWKSTLELGSRQRATNRHKFFHTGHVESLGRDEQMDIFILSAASKGEEKLE